MSRPRLPAQPTLAQLRALIAVADAGGFSEAAAELNVSQSSLSEAVGKLEDVVGRPLLRRTPAGTVVTPAGERVLSHARQAVQAASDVLLAAQEPQALSGVLRVASFRSTATHLLPPALAAFRQRHPGVTIKLLDGEARGGGAAQVRSGHADLAVVIGADLPELTVVPLMLDEYLFIAPQSRGTHPVTWAELTDAPLIIPPGPNSCNVLLREYLRARDIEAHISLEIEEDSVILGMVGHGLGCSVMPRLALEPAPPGVVSLPLPEPFTRPLAVAVLPHRAHLPVIRTFTQTLIGSLKAGLPPGQRSDQAHQDALFH